ncbi:MAG: hypothetical protein PSV26_07965, partial [Polaromonas sp.]|uniref:hypothetical protein n=1 Tax=Polaromonas sp. TaxID=1869339 RepID=UPI0024884796
MPVSSRTSTVSTPGTALKARLTALTHDPHVMPFTFSSTASMVFAPVFLELGSDYDSQCESDLRLVNWPSAEGVENLEKMNVP